MGEREKEIILLHIDEVSDDLLEISADLNRCGEAIACEKCSSKLIAAAAAIKSTKKKMQG